MVGALLLDAGPLPGGVEAAFLSQRVRDLCLAGAAAVLLSGIASFVLARHILVPIRQVAAGARLLASGDFSARIAAGPRDELGRLVADFNHLALALDSAEQARRRWVADTSHELRTPLAVLRAQIEAMQDGVQPVSDRSLANLHGEVLRMTQLVGDLHELSRADAGALAMQRELDDPSLILRDVLESFAARREEAGLLLDSDALVPSARPVAVDPDRLRQVFSNVLENAIRYTDRGGTIRVSSVRVPDNIAVCIEDSAPGVPPAKLPRIFDRFYRAETSRSRETGGSGLGLAISKAILQAHGGTITAAASPLGGLSVTIALPMTPSAS